ncbi:MAG: type II toxin-antitoxin system VapC family toxin, partial [bacterium]
DKLSETAKTTYLDNTNEIYLSVVSLWEMAIKISKKKLKVAESLSRFVEKYVVGSNIKILDVTTEHILPLSRLPFHHRDPFDRLLVSQCMHEQMKLISKDSEFDAYRIERIW